MAEALDGSTVGVMAEGVDGLTADRHLCLRPPLERIAQFRVNRPHLAKK